MTGLLLSRLALACACSVSWRRLAPPLYRASAVAERYERYEHRFWQAPAFFLAWVCGLAALPFLAIGMSLQSVAAWLMPQREDDGKRSDLGELEG